MDTNAQIISDFQNRISFNQPIDFISTWKGVPVMVRGQIQEIRAETIVFQLEPPDSICFEQKEEALILHDVFIMGIRGQILSFDPLSGIAELGSFIYVDRGFGDREISRVEPDDPINAELTFEETSIMGAVIDISLNGFGVLVPALQGLDLAQGQTLTLKLNLLDQAIEIPGNLLGVYPREEIIRLAISFSPQTPANAIVTQYITRRREEIRQEIQAAYQETTGKDN